MISQYMLDTIVDKIRLERRILLGMIGTCKYYRDRLVIAIERDEEFVTVLD